MYNKDYYFQFLTERANILKAKDDESIVNSVDEKSNEIPDDETTPETQTADTDAPATEVAVSNSTTANETQ